MSNPTSQPNSAPPVSPTQHSLTGAEACRLLSGIRAILYRVADGHAEADQFDPDKDHGDKELEAIVNTLEEAGLAPQDWAEYQDVVLRRAALREIAAIGNKMSGGDWEEIREEITQARQIAMDALGLKGGAL